MTEEGPNGAESVQLILAAVLLGAVGVAWLVLGAPAGLGVALAGLLTLFLLGFRSILREELRYRRQLEERLPLLLRLREAAGRRVSLVPADAETEGEGAGTGQEANPFPDSGLRKRFALGTVAVLRGSLEPEQIESVAREQTRRRSKRFGLVAVELGFLTLAQLADLVRAQREGRFSIAEMRRARKILIESRRGAERAGAGAAEERSPPRAAPHDTPKAGPQAGPRTNPQAGPQATPPADPQAGPQAGPQGPTEGGRPGE